MPGSTYLPRTEAELVNFSANFAAQINASPAQFGLVPLQATNYQSLHDGFVAAHATVNNDPNGRTPGNVAAKNAAKAALIDGPDGIRQLVAIIQAFPGTTDVDRVQLWLTVRDPEPTRAPVPPNAPGFQIVSVIGQSVKYRLRDPGSGRRGKPQRVAGAVILSYIGPQAPLNAREWQSLGNVMRTDGTLTFPSWLVPPGSKVWLTAAWFNPRGEQGPLSNPVSVFLAGGLSQAA